MLRRHTGTPRPGTRRPTRRQGGFDRLTTDLIFARDAARCIPQVVCDGRGWTVVAHHRKNRGMGGSTDPQINWPSNGLTACEPCNDAMEAATVATMYENGWKVRNASDPRDVSVLYPDGHHWWLNRDGGRFRITSDGRQEWAGG